MTLYDARSYWDRRLEDQFSLSGTGNILFSEAYNRWLYQAKLRAWHRALSSLGVGLAGKRVLDIGCGTGFFVEQCRRLGVTDLVGVDITPASISRLGRRYPEFSFLEADVAKADLADLGQFDLALVFDVLYHIVDDVGFAQAVRQVSRALRPGGWLLVADRGGERTEEPAPHVKFRAREIYREHLEASRVRLVSVVPMYYLLNLSAADLGLGNRFLAPLARRLLHRLGPVLYALDGRLASDHRANLRLLVGQKE